MARHTSVRRDGVATDQPVRDRFGGIDLAACLVGMLTAIAMMLLLGGIVTAIAANEVNYQSALVNIEDVSIGAAITSLVILIVSFLVGGWAAGRMARFDGVRNGIVVGVLAILLSIVLGALTAWAGDAYNLVPNVDLNALFNASDEQLTSTAVIGAVLALLAILLSGAFGGMLGERYHDRVDAAMLDTPGVGRVDQTRVVSAAGGSDTPTTDHPRARAKAMPSWRHRFGRSRD